MRREVIYTNKDKEDSIPVKAFLIGFGPATVNKFNSEYHGSVFTKAIIEIDNKIDSVYLSEIGFVNEEKRTVKFRIWIPVQYQPSEGGKSPVPNTGCWSEFNHSGYFHQWGSSYEEFEAGPGNFTVAIVERKDGTLVEVLPTNLIFITA